MYNETIDVSNKIISDRDLAEIFQRMDEDIKLNKKICDQEAVQNEKFAREYQKWTTKQFEGAFKCRFDFYDSTSINVDNYDAFLTIFNNRLSEVRNMYVNFYYNYTIQNGTETKYVAKHITMNIFEYKMNIEVKLGSEDNKMVEVYQLIKDKVLNAPERYDRIVKNKNTIVTKVCFAMGIIIGLVIFTLAGLVPFIRELYGSTYVLYPFLVVAFGFAVGVSLFGGKIEKLYSTIVPSKRYAGYDPTTYKSVYRDDLDDYLGKSEIIIGKNINNIKNREEIKLLEEKYGKFIPIEILITIALSVIMVVAGKLL